ncbi:MAG: glycosyltransferase family 4 protein [Firmicutes bacterium]|nr:glycosyltransferase family 4 protein [Bacillota bacterium]
MADIAILTSVFYQRTAELDGEDRVIWGGAERYLLELCRLLKEDGHAVRVYQAWSGQQVVRKEYAGVPIYLLPAADNWQLHTAPSLNLIFNDLALGADLRIYFATFLCWPEVRRPAISICHGIWWDYPHSVYGRASAEARLEFLRRHLYGVTAPDLCVAVDANTRNFVAAYSPGSEVRIRVVPNFVDTRVFYPRQEEATWERVRILFPRRLAAMRGLNDVLAAAGRMPDCDFILCGQAHDPEAEEFARHLAGTSQAPNVRFEWHTPDEMPEVYRQADIAVIPTRAAEGTSLACLEAMASGLPVVATPAGGLPQLIVHGYNGWLVDLNHGSLVPALAYLAKDPKLRALFGKRNREIAVAAFDIRRWRAAWRRALREVLKEGNRGAQARHNQHDG